MKKETRKSPHLVTNTLLRTLCAALFFVLQSSLFSIYSQMLYTPFPSSFKNVRTNELIEGSSLRPVFEKLHSKKTVKVMLIGDSHTKGNIYPRNVGTTLSSYFPTIEFNYYGINGAWARRFFEPDMIQKVADENPDLVIISFGTNEAHAGSFDQSVHHQTLHTLTDRISQRCRNVSFIITTPPGSFISKRTGSYTTGRGRHRRTVYTTEKTRNDRNDQVAKSIVNYGHANHCAVWDLFTIAGGVTHACINWRDANLMAADQIHYNVQGYQLQGKLLGEAIYKAYLATPAKGTQTRMHHEHTPQEAKPHKSLKGW